jgi:hypothetical protein
MAERRTLQRVSRTRLKPDCILSPCNLPPTTKNGRLIWNRLTSNTNWTCPSSTGTTRRCFYSTYPLHYGNASRRTGLTKCRQSRRSPGFWPSFRHMLYIHLGANPSVDLGLGGQHEVTSSGVGFSACIDSLDLRRAIIKPPHNPAGVSIHHCHALDHTAKQFRFHSYASGKFKRMHQGLFWSRYAVRIQIDFERPIAPGNHSIAVAHPTTDINDILFDPAEQISAQVTLHRNSQYVLDSNDPTPRFVLA